MNETISWLFLFLLVFNVAERFGTLSDLIVLTNLLTVLVAGMWVYLTYKNRKKASLPIKDEQRQKLNEKFNQDEM